MFGCLFRLNTFTPTLSARKIELYERNVEKFNASLKSEINSLPVRS